MLWNTNLIILCKCSPHNSTLLNILPLQNCLCTFHCWAVTSGLVKKTFDQKSKAFDRCIMLCAVTLDMKGVNWLSFWFTESVFQWKPINSHHSLLLNINLIIISLFSEYSLMTSMLFISHSSSSVGQVLFSLNKSKQLETILFWYVIGNIFKTKHPAKTQLLRSSLLVFGTTALCKREKGFSPQQTLSPLSSCPMIKMAMRDWCNAVYWNTLQFNDCVWSGFCKLEDKE